MRDDGGGMRDERNAVSYPVLFIPHPSSLILHPSSLRHHPLNLISMRGRLAITASPTALRLRGEILSSVSSGVCQCGYELSCMMSAEGTPACRNGAWSSPPTPSARSTNCLA